MNKFPDIIKSIKKINWDMTAKTQDRLDHLTKPQGSLGRLEDLAKQITAITQEENPSLKDKVIFTFAADHGVAEEGVSAFPQEVTAQMVYNFLRGGAGINVLANHAGARVVIADLGVASDLSEHPGLYAKKVAYGTKNMARGPAMSPEQALASIENGIAIFEEEFQKGVHLVGTGEMGIANTTAASAIVSVITGKSVAEVTSRGTGISDEALATKIQVISRSIQSNSPCADDGMDVLAKVGGFEIGGLTGVILAAAARNIPVVIDGFISTAAALIACQMEPKVRDYLIASHCSVEQGHRVALDYLDLKPLFDFQLRLGEGTGAALAFSPIEASIKILTEMATFETAAVSEKIHPSHKGLCV